MVRNKQNRKIKKAWFNSTFVDEQGEITTYLSLLGRELKKYRISAYVFKEYLNKRNRNKYCLFPKQYIDKVVSATYKN